MGWRTAVARSVIIFSDPLGPPPPLDAAPRTSEPIGHTGQFAATDGELVGDLGHPTLSSELKEGLATGIAAETAGRGIAELAAWRDRFVVDLLALRARQK